MPRGLVRCLSLGAALGAWGCSPSGVAFHSDFADVSRVWIGPEYYANRLLDWRIQDGRLESIEGSTAKPMRTVHLLTHALRERSGTLTMAVRTGPIEPGNAPEEHTWTGFLLGVGGDHVDFRISALSHHWPGEDGGLIVAVDGTGRIVARDNAHGDGPRGPRGDYPLSAWPLIEPAAAAVSGRSNDFTLHLDAEATGDAYRLHAVAVDAVTGDTLATATYDGIDADHFSGNVALVSHHSPNLTGPGYWFRDWRVAGSKVVHHPERAFGPIMGAMHTLSRGTLKITAQMGPLGPADNRTAEFHVRRGGRWRTAATGELVEDSYTIPFRVDGWNDDGDTPYRIVYELRTGGDTTRTYEYAGTIRRPPVDRDTVVLGAFTGIDIASGGGRHWNHGSIWYPHNELVAAVRHHDPDMLFFSGDQIYESGLGGVIRQPTDLAVLDYLYHWYRFVWAFRDLTRDVPTVATPDDHDVYHGNIWGAGGIKAEGDFRPVADNGGYIMDPRWVNAVHRSQTSHLPDPVDPTPIEQGITVYHTDVEYAGVSFAVVADRMFKSPPRRLIPEGQVVNGWFQNPDFDPTTQADVPGAVLLGNRQLQFLEQWAGDWSDGTWMKVLLSQTLFSNLATIPDTATSGAVLPSLAHPDPDEYVENDKKAADADSNGWPQSGRNRALRTIRKAFAFHVAGDQHLGSFSRYGIDDFNDAGYAFVVPASANLWPRRWYPPEPGANREPGAPRYTGEHFDGFGNRMTVRGVTNPVKSGVEPTALYDRNPGYGIVRFNRTTRDITVEAWPRWVDPGARGAEQFLGWPMTVNQLDNYGRRAAGYLPTITVSGMTGPVVRVTDESTGEVVYALRITGTSFRPKVFSTTTTYSVWVGEPTGPNRTYGGLRVTTDESESLEIVF